MDVDAKSESESEDEVCTSFVPWFQHFRRNNLIPRRRNFSLRVQWRLLEARRRIAEFSLPRLDFPATA